MPYDSGGGVFLSGVTAVAVVAVVGYLYCFGCAGIDYWCSFEGGRLVSPLFRMPWLGLPCLGSCLGLCLALPCLALPWRMPCLTLPCLALP